MSEIFGSVEIRNKAPKETGALTSPNQLIGTRLDDRKQLQVPMMTEGNRDEGQEKSTTVTKLWKYGDNVAKK